MDATEILITIRKIVRSINLESKKIQKTHGVSIPQILCLSYLHASPNFQSTQGEIRQFLNLNSSTASGIIDRLEMKGLLARLPKQGDKRVVSIVLTSKGASLLKNVPTLMHEQLSVKLKSLSESTLYQMKESLNILVTLLNIGDAEAVPMLSVEESVNNEK